MANVKMGVNDEFGFRIAIPLDNPWIPVKIPQEACNITDLN